MDYYISKNDGQYSGPYKKDQLISNGLDLDDLVWREGLASWMPVNQLPELSDIIQDVPPPMEMTLGPVQVVQQPVQQVTNEEVLMQKQLEHLNKEKEELNKLLEQKKSEGDKKLVAAREQHLTEKKEQKKKEDEKAKKAATKSKKKTKYDHPVASWLNESIWLLVFVFIHAIMALAGCTTFEYFYFDIVGAVLSITGIVIGCKIKKLNKVSYKKNSESRLKAESLSRFNGFLTSANAAAGFLIILVQSAYYVYTS